MRAAFPPFLPVSYRDWIMAKLGEIDTLLSGFVRGQLLAEVEAMKVFWRDVLAFYQGLLPCLCSPPPLRASRRVSASLAYSTSVNVSPLRPASMPALAKI